MNDVLLVVSNLPDRATAEHIAAALVEKRLAACVNILAECQSIYRWQGKVEHASEVPLLIKTTRAAYPALESMLGEMHPYDTPEILALPVTAGWPPYLDWVKQEIQED